LTRRRWEKFSGGKIEKLQAPTSKLQRNSNNQASKARVDFDWSLMIGASLELGAWNLDV
jgi:hypothetical protein